MLVRSDNCTSTPQDDFEANVCCVVTGGKCKAKTTFSTGVGTGLLLSSGNSHAFSLGELSLYRAALSPSQPAFKSGLLVQ